MSSLARIIVPLALLGVLILAGGSLVWLLAYAVDEGPPDRQSVGGLRDTVRITWGTQRDVSIDAADLEDAMTALGYVHGRTRAWSIVLWRQAALGRLGEWFGQPALPLDQLAHHLGLASLAQASYSELTEEDHTILHAYSAGLNTALQESDIQLQQEFVLLELDLEPWQPWHTLALERLFAWLASPPPTPDVLSETDPQLTAFFATDHALRQWLHIHGFENSLAWASRDTAGTHFFQRHVYGSTALPFLQELSLNLEEGASFRGASLPGTPFFPAGQTDEWSWALFINGRVYLEQRPWNLDPTPVTYQRILSRDATEHLTAFRRTSQDLPFPPAQVAPSDTIWAIRWSGLTAGTDCAAWRGLLTGEDAPFTLLAGNGLRVREDGTWQILGAPPVIVPFASGLFVGLSPWSRYAAEFLRSQLSGSVDLEVWIDDAYSIWAAQTAPPLVNAVGAEAPDTPVLRDAITYLRNWDYAYDRASIAASIFDNWVMRYFDATGILPDTTRLDSVAAHPLLRQTLSETVEALADTFGSDLSQWRWERLNPDRRFFPIWSAEALLEGTLDLKAVERFAPVEWPGRGHPSAFAWGPSPIQRALPAPAAWEAWHHPNAGNRLTVRRQLLDPRIPLGRYLTSDRSPDPMALTAPVSPTSTTLLTPTR